jgi:hypothetical protein
MEGFVTLIQICAAIYGGCCLIGLVLIYTRLDQKNNTSIKLKNRCDNLNQDLTSLSERWKS